MTRETKIGLLVGMGVIVLVGMILTDLLSIRPHDEISPLLETTRQYQDSLAPPLGEDHIIEQDTPVGVEAVPPGLPSVPHDRRVGPNQALAKAFDIQRQDKPSGQITDSPEAEAVGSQGEIVYADVVIKDFLYRPSDQRKNIYYVKNGDSLFSIAKSEYGDGNLHKLIWDANPKVVQPGGHVRSGVRLVIPPLPTHGQASLGSTKANQPAALETTAITTSRRTVVVRAGDTLSDLARTHLGSAQLWPHLLKANRDQIDAPESIRPGMELRLPQSSSWRTKKVAGGIVPITGSGGGQYTVKPGDSLWKIARGQLGDGERLYEIYDRNRDRLANENDLSVGQVLVLPRR